MDMRNPVQSLTWALGCALERDLHGVESITATQLLALPAGKPLVARPKLHDCSVVLFTQCWTLEGLGFAQGDDPKREVMAETTIVTGPCGDACVYAGTQLLYHVDQPNRRFFLDVAAQNMRGPAHSVAYEGRDSADEEAFDYEVAGSLARVCAALKHLPAAEAHKVVQCLQACVEQVAAAAEGAGPTSH